MSIEVRGLRNQWGVSPWDRTSAGDRTNQWDRIGPRDQASPGEHTGTGDRASSRESAKAEEHARPLGVSDFHEVGKHPEVVIIGAGLTGLSTAYHLAKLD